jgi:hypothetical protein
VAGCCGCGDEPSGSCVMELVSTICIPFIIKYVSHTVITEFVLCLLLRYEYVIIQRNAFCCT